MKKTRKISKRVLYQIILLAAVFLLTMLTVFHGQSLPELAADVANAEPSWLFLAILCLLAYLSLQGLIIWIEFKALHLKVSLFKCMLIAYHGYFYCSITPMQSGGPAVQLVDLKKERIRFAESSIVILIMTFFFKLVLLIAGICLITLGLGFTAHYLLGVLPLFILGMLMTGGLSVFTALFIFHPALARKIIEKIGNWMKRKRIFRPVFRRWPNLIERLLGTMERYHSVAGFFRRNKPVMALLILVTALQRTMYYLSAWCSFKSLGIDLPLWLVLLLHASISIGADTLPVPGGMGASEGMFLILFRNLIQKLMLVPSLVVSRGITYYGQLIICGAVSILAKLYLGRHPAGDLPENATSVIEEL
ncbi:MAG: lysylphosphatidylglycerol synthase transmembrane domain-containing protein [Eubacterium sp.]|nr:lysylphosphatidylglycerol synthase transmembrane domain-containing protein [Eubacterium sp.]